MINAIATAICFVCIFALMMFNRSSHRRDMASFAREQKLIDLLQELNAENHDLRRQCDHLADRQCHHADGTSS